MRLILTADDYGRDKKTTDAIIESLRRGYITQMSLMVNMDDAERAVKTFKDSGLDSVVGLHLNLIEGVPITDEIKNYTNWCDRNGCFNNAIRSRPIFWKIASQAEKKAVEEEMVAQINKYRGYGLNPFHCDGHQHCQVRWSIMPILFPLLRDFGFSSVRRPNNIRLLNFSMRRPSLRERYLNAIFFSNIKRFGLRTCDYMDGFTQFLPFAGNLSKGDKTIEIMLHPGYSAGGELVNLYESKENRIAEIFEAVKGAILTTYGRC